MFDEVFGGISFGDLASDKKKCPCGCVCVCYGGEEDRVANTNSRASTIKATELAADPNPN